MAEILKSRGLYYIENIINGDKIFKEIDPEHYYSVGSAKNSRQVIQYGRPFLYQGQSSEDVPIRLEQPEYIKELRTIAIKQCLENKLIKGDIDEILDSKLFNQCIINKYEPGQKISAHTDLASYGKIVACFSILSSINISFNKKKCAKDDEDDENNVIDLYVKKNSLYIMSGEVRYNWTHEIRGVKTDLIKLKSGSFSRIKRSTRISITFRTNEYED